MDAETAPLLALAGLILLKEAGIPIPVPGDLVVLGAGVTASRGDLDPVITIVALIVASSAAPRLGRMRAARPASRSRRSAILPSGIEWQRHSEGPLPVERRRFDPAVHRSAALEDDGEPAAPGVRSRA
jgi:hypothetical protein